MIAIIKYGLGNIDAIANIYKRLNIEVRFASTPADLDLADKIILPGVGAFDWAMTRLTESGMRLALTDATLIKRKPVLGICVGMQMLAQKSEEGQLPGLGWIEGEVKKFNIETLSHKTPLPHMGWNNVNPCRTEGLFRGFDNTSRFYFLHSYYFAPLNQDHVLAVTDYNGRYASSVGSGNILGVQFHPEKSHRWGIQLLKNFAEL